MADEFFPAADELLALELRGLAGLAAFHELASTELKHVWLAATELNQRLQFTRTNHFDFHSHFSIMDSKSGDLRRVDVGAKVECSESGAEYRQVSYFFSIGYGDECPGKILRKVHFDFEPVANRSSDEQKPSLHWQMPGTLPPPLTDLGYADDAHLDHLAPWYEKPRIPCLPTSLVLLLNLLFLEFGDGYNDSLLNLQRSTWWRGLIDEAERMLYERFFQNCVAYWNGNPPAGSFVQRHLYGIVGDAGTP